MYILHATDQIVDETKCNEIEGLTINSTPETTGVTSFVSDAGVCAGVPVQPVTGFSAGTPEVQDLKEYFRRPRMISTFVAATARSNLLALTIDDGLIFVNWFPQGFDRLLGVEGVRFNMVFTLTTSSNPFHQGCLAMSYQYGYKLGDPDVVPRYLSNALVTNLPHVRLDFATETMVQLTVPWLLPEDWATTGLNVTDFGILAVNQILPTPSLTNSSAPVLKLYVHLEDLELIGSAPASREFVVAQSGLATTNMVRTVANFVNKASVVDQELKKTKVISKTLGGVKSVLDYANRIPLLSSISGSLSWANDIARGVASVFGYSKPRDSRNPARKYTTDYVGDINVDMPNAAWSLSPFASNRIQVDSTLGGIDQDEMAFAYILSKYSQIFMGSINVADAVGARIYATAVCPTHFWFRTNNSRPGGNIAWPGFADASTNVVQPSTIAYFAQMFRYWRGGLKFRFHFGKTKFHGGRVLIGFVADTRDSTNTNPIGNSIPATEVVASLVQPFSYSKIFDLRDDNVVEFDVDWLSPNLYISTNGSIGGLTMTIVDPLIANGEASTTINFLVEVCAKEDFQLSFPSPISMAAATGATSLAFRESGLGVINHREPAEYTAGEHVASVKQLIMIPSSTSVTVANTTTNSTTLPPWNFYPRWTMAVPMSATSQQVFAFHRGGLIAHCYAFFNGSTSYHVYSDGDAIGLRTAVYYAPSDASVPSPFGAASPYSKTTTTGVPVIFTNRASVHFEVPLYSKYARLPQANYWTAAGGAARNWQPNSIGLRVNSKYTATLPTIVTRNSSGVSRIVVMQIAAADDARLAGYLGPPPVITFQNAQAVSPELSSNL